MPKLGRLPNQGRPRLKLIAELVPSEALTPPPAVDNYSKVPAQSWGVQGNDRYGDCTCAELDHTVKALQVAAGNTEVRSSTDEVLAIYAAVSGFNPNDPSSDRGAEMQAVRDHWRREGIVLGGKLDRIALFAEIDHRDLMLVRWCIARFGTLGVGVALPESAQQQFAAGQPWEVDAESPIEGGHAICAVGYDEEHVYFVTWGRVVKATWAWWVAYVDECWTQLSQDFVNAVTGDDPLGETLHALGEQFCAITGQQNPFVR